MGKCETLESWALRIQSSRIGNRSAVFVHVGKQGSDRYRGGLVLQESPGGKWQEHRLGTDFSNKELTVAFDRKWGTIISWTDGPAGNFVIAGQGLRASAATVAIAKTPKTPKTPVKPVRPAALPPGQLRLEPGDPKRTYPLEVDGAANFKSPDSTRGPLTRRARIGVFKAGDMTFHAAADWTKARFKYPDVVRIDFSGSGDFKTSHVVKRSTMEGTQDSDSLRCWFTAESVPVRINGRDLKINLRCYYARSPTEESLLVRLGLSAVGRCYFGKKLHKVRLVDGNGNFRFDDPTKPVTRPRGAWTNTTKSDYEKCDAIEVYPSTPQPRRTMWPAYYGHPVLVDGVLYDVKVSSDATKISATPYKGATAKIRIDHDHWNAWFCGKKHIVRLSGSRQPVSLPPDVYTIVGYYQQETTKEGKRKRDNVYGVDPNSSPVTAEVKSDMTTAIPIGSPIQAVLVPRERGRTVRFDVYLVGVGGRKKAGSTPVILAARQSRSPIPRANR